YYDPQIGRWHAVDARAEKRLENSQFSFVSNNPILNIDPNGKWDITVHVYQNREAYNYGVAIVKDNKGNEIFRFNVRVEGIAGRDRMEENSDTPLGIYDIPDNNAWLEGGSRKSYGPNPRLVLNPISGEISQSNRSDIRIHGGRQEKYNSLLKQWQAEANPKLKPTKGCIRAFDSDMKELKRVTDNLQKNDATEKPGELKVVADLEVSAERSGFENFVEAKVIFNVPEDQKEYWMNEVQKLYNFVYKK
ncbi:MAG: L,D-transpeptidase family protein, partial [Bacteroidia bacterium]